jgi:hypothetical protein
MAGQPEHLLVNVLEPATEIGLISLDDLKIMLDIPAADTSKDEQLQMMIDQNSMMLAQMANRETWAKEKVVETWECVEPVCCPDGSCRIWLTRVPVKKADIESVESPAGYALDPADYDLEERTGQLKIPGGCSTQIIITYTGGYDLPDEAPLPLQQAAGLAVQQFRTQAQQAATGGSGIRMLAHKESRIMYFSPKDMAGGGSSGATTTSSAADTAIKNLISKYTRFWM